MRLSRALELDRQQVVSFVGAGGKTTAMFRLAEELSGQGWRVITTTTTQIWREERCGHTILEPDGHLLLEKVREVLAERGHITVASGCDEAEGKLMGIDPELAGDLIALPDVDVVLVEADGAKSRSLKAPAQHEPQIPSSTSILVPVAAVDALGLPLDERIVHRPEILAGLVGAEMGQIITPQLVSQVLLHPQGGLKGAPPGARVLPLLNKVPHEGPEPAREIAVSLLKSNRVSRVLLGTVAETNPVREVWGRTAAVVLAAGGSTRFGSPKLLLPWKGKTLLEHVVDTVLESSVEKVVVVLGHEADRFSALLKSRPVEVVVNEEWESGQSSSVRAGMGRLPESNEACVFILADQPHVTPELVDQILSRYRRTLAPIVLPVYGGQRGNPVLFDKALFAELLQMEGDQGGRQLIERYHRELEAVEVSDPRLFLDIDTVSDYEEAREE